ncbi:MAG: T9SS type A sorting domain-containing protein, partial [Ferruginibacter sp.]
TLTVDNLASITSQPANSIVCTGNDANFTVGAATSTTTVTYQWEVSTDGGTTYVPIPGATSQALTVTAVTSAMDGNLYHVILSNGCTTSLVSGAATLTVAALPVISASPVDASACENSTATFNVTATGNGLSYQWQESTDGGTTFTDLNGQTAATLSLTGVTTSMNNNQYQVVVSSSCSAFGIASSPAVLTVNALPTLVISAAPYTSLTTQLTTVLTATATPASSVFSWYLDGVLIPASTGNTITVTHDDLGVYTASVTDANTCTNISNALTISDSTASNAFVYPNPGRGIFNLVFDLTTGITNKVSVGAFDSKGARVYQKQFDLVTSVQTIAIDLSKLAKGIYILEITDAAGVRVRTERVVIY